jgi:DNA-binding HxlR family transcriptional regulator
MAGMRTYGDACRTAHALDLVGERWALLVVRELLLGPKRFTDLRAGLPRAAPDVLAQRLRELEGAGVVRRRKLGPPAGSRVYELTEWGAELEPVVRALGRWGARSPLADEDLEMSVDATALALKSDFDPDAAKGLVATYAVRLGEDEFRVAVADQRIDVSRDEVDRPDAEIEAVPRALADVLWGDRPLSDAQRAGEISLEGDKAKAKRFFTLFPLPAQVEVPAA